MTTTTTDAKIYIACLASYNSGVLHGEWITPKADKEELQEQINKVLKSSKIPNAEEWAIHDYNEFPNLGEYPGLDNIIKVQEAIDEHGQYVVSAFLENWSVEDLDHIDDAYYGEYDSFSQFAENMADETILIDCPDNVKFYFDYEKWERDLSYDYHEGEGENGTSLIFNANW
tara:strand:- start:14 stop:529 length:516 start_codon:yes stop_codon:yes gene_type:complete